MKKCNKLEQNKQRIGDANDIKQLHDVIKIYDTIAIVGNDFNYKGNCTKIYKLYTKIETVSPTLLTATIKKKIFKIII